MAKTWTSSDIPSQQGRSVVVTCTGGLGFEDAKALAQADVEVIIAGRNPTKGQEAVAHIRQAVPTANVRFEMLDLASLESIAAFGERLRSQRSNLDVLINNAGVMTPPTRRTTGDGFELQFGTNYLGHFALTAALLPLLRKGAGSRVITLSSIAARDGQIHFDDLQAERGYKPMPVYAKSKLACLMFAFELQRRSDAAGWGIQSIAAHPGISRTDLLPNGAATRSTFGIARRFLWFLFQPAAQGALPTLFAATSPQADPGRYYGLDQMSETRGYPALAKPPAQSLDLNVAKKLWDVLLKLSATRFG